MSFEGFDAIYRLSNADFLAGMRRIESEAVKHAGRMDRIYAQAGRSIEKTLFGANIGRAVGSSMGLAFGLGIRLARDYASEVGDTTGAVERLDKALRDLKLGIGRDMVPLMGDLAAGISAINTVRQGAVDTITTGLRTGGGWTDNLLAMAISSPLMVLGAKGYHALAGTSESESAEALRSAMDEAERIALQDREEKKSLEKQRRGAAFEAERIAAAAAMARDRDMPLQAASLEARAIEMRAAADAQRQLMAGEITVAQKHQLIAEAQARADSVVEKAIRSEREQAQRREETQRRQDATDQEKSGAAKEQAASRIRSENSARREYEFDLRALEAQAKRLRGDDKGARAIEARLAMERKVAEILDDQILTAGERDAMVLRVQSVYGDIEAAANAGSDVASRFTYDSLGSGRAAAAVSRLVFGPEGARGGQGADPALAEARKQTRLLEDIRERTGPARYGQ